MTVVTGILLLAFVIVVLYVVFPGTTGNGGPSPANATPAAFASPAVESSSKIGDFNVDKENYNDSDGLTASQKIDAIKMVIVSDLMKQSTNGYCNGDYSNGTVSEVVPLDERGKVWMPGTDGGFLRLNTSLTAVPVQYHIGPTYYYVLFYVDLSGRRLSGYDEAESKVGESGYAIIPPGKSWYFKLVRRPDISDNDFSDIVLRMSWNASDSGALYPLIMDEASFNLYKNGSSVVMEEFTSATSGEKLALDGYSPLEPKGIIENGTAFWTDTIRIKHSLPAGTYSAFDYYIVVKNADKNREIPVNVSVINI